MHCSRMEDAVKAYIELGTLIVEGRLPAEGTDRGYKEGPHCSPTASHQKAHQCDPSNFSCVRAERLRKHLSLLASNTLPMCVEVLLCPVCQCGTNRAQNPEVANIPSTSDLLLEQWIVSVVHLSSGPCSSLNHPRKRCLDLSETSLGGEPCNMSLHALFQAVRSQLHFSQLSAWWSCSRGTCPTNVSYRLTMPEEAFSSRFSRPAQQHTFPPAAVGPNTQLKVLVRTLPRSENVPSVKCETCTPETSVRKRSIGLEQPLLGESLLDPPGPSSSRAHAGLCKWHTGTPPSPPRRRVSRQATPRRSDKHQASSYHIMPLPGPVDDRMQTNCNQHGKHDCRCEEDVEEIQTHKQKHNEAATNKINLDLSKKEMEEVLTVLRVRTPDSVKVSSQTNKVTGKGDLLLSAILRTSQTQAPNFQNKLQIDQNTQYSSFFNLTSSIKNFDLKSTYDSSSCATKKFLQHAKPPLVDEIKEKQVILPYAPVIEFEIPTKQLVKRESSLCLSDSDSGNEDLLCKERSSSGPLSSVERSRTKQCLKKDDGVKCQDEVNDLLAEQLNQCDLNKGVETSNGKEVPSASDKAKFRQSLDDAASMVFHSRTGLPLTSSPAPLRRASPRFDFDSSINSVSAIRSALFDGERGCVPEEQPTSKSPQMDIPSKSEPWAVHHQSPGSALLGSFEESVLNGRLEPVSTVHGFTADLGASGSFCPGHVALPVTVFFYTLGDIDKISSPYLAHINLGKKGYLVPRVGTIQVTLLNPLGTVIKMFVVMYNLTDMPNNSHTFLRQRTLYMPNNINEPLDGCQKYLRYLIHLRFASSKSGRLSLHTDIRMIIFRKSDMDTATGHGVDLAYELRSFTYGPTNPKFSPRK